MKLVSRSEAGLRPPTSGYTPWPRGCPWGIAIHYVGGAGHIGLVSHNQCAGQWRSMQAYAMSGNYKWTFSDIEYNLGVCPHGYVFVGRGLEGQGAAQKGANSTHLSICYLANVADTVTLDGDQGLRDAIGYAKSRHPSIREVVGHRDTAGNPTGTACPGVHLEAWLHGAAPNIPTQEDDDMTPDQAAALARIDAFMRNLSLDGSLKTLDERLQKVEAAVAAMPKLVLLATAAADDANAVKKKLDA